MEFSEFDALSGDVAEWGRRNFPANGRNEALLGCAEEIGELAHAVLKRAQGIRHTPAELDAMERDAVADLVIFMANGWARRGEPYAELPDDYARVFRLLRLVAALTRHGGLGSRADVEFLLDQARRYGEAKGWSLAGVVAETWARVSRRDFRADPMGGGEPAPAGWAR